jgi:hypothetical protein
MLQWINALSYIRKCPVEADERRSKKQAIAKKIYSDP